MKVGRHHAQSSIANDRQRIMLQAVTTAGEVDRTTAVLSGVFTTQKVKDPRRGILNPVSVVQTGII